MGYRRTKSVYVVDITFTHAGSDDVDTAHLLVHTGVEQRMKTQVRRFLACDALTELSSQRFGGVKTYAPRGQEGCTIRAELWARKAVPDSYFSTRNRYQYLCQGE